MLKLRLKFSKKSIDIYLLTFLFIMLSGAVVGYAYAVIFDPLFLIFSFVYHEKYCRNTHFLKEKILVMLILVAFHVVSLFVYINDNASITAYLSYIIRIIACFFFCSSMNNDEFEDAFEKVICVIATFSMICFIISQTIGVVSFAHEIGSHTVLFLYNYNGYMLHRNSGIFWEPGAYQLFLNLAILFRLKRANFNYKKIFNFGNVLLIVSLLTTRSTTGYFIFLAIMIYWVYKNWEKMSIGNKFFSIIPLIVLVAVAIVAIFNTDTVYMKFFGYGNSYNIRINDFNQSIGAILNKPFRGYGIGTNAVTRMSYERGITANSVGIFCATINFGIVYTGYYVYRIFKYIRNNQNGLMPIFMVLFLLSMLTEDFFRYAIYFVIAIGFTERKKKHVRKFEKVSI